MAVTLQEVCHGRGAIFDCSGAVNGEELIQSKFGLDKQPERLGQWCFAIVDHTNATTADYSLTDIQRLTEIDRRLAKLVPNGFLIAVVSPDDFIFGVSRMWQSIADSLGWEILITRRRDQAEHWLRERARQRFALDIDPCLFEGSEAEGPAA